ncbi:hypothetical protein CANINC_004198 [Pichia inconspicua]|uniref:Maintenance of telomere capping protein 1 n=1 Tax=Pichia inconspicua TaxID=52247 RepID=A0A4T0WWW7_9ASCO|nr:hypothetical protein CANINC_004198 [[Candida] inconspicua]
MSNEKEILEFLDSLPEGEEPVKGDGDAEILDFLDELEGPAIESKSVEQPKVEESSTVTTTEATTEEQHVVESTATPVTETSTNDKPTASAIASIASWWNGSGAEKVSEVTTKLSTLGVGALQGVLSEQHDLGEARAVVEGSLEFVGKSVAEIIGRGVGMSRNEDERIEIVLTHDMRNFHGLKEMIRGIFEDVMSKQVDGSIDVSVVEKGRDGTDSGISFGIFEGNVNDAEKLLRANIDNEASLRGEVEGTTSIYVSIGAWTSGSDGNMIGAGYKGSVTFMSVLKDVDHGIEVVVQSQSVPLKWCKWIEGEKEEGDDVDDEGDEIEPSEWVIEWVTESIRNLIGVTSQSYIIKRMGY